MPLEYMLKFGKIYIDKSKFHIQVKTANMNYVNNIENTLVSNKYSLEEKCFIIQLYLLN